jgi:hypothetical protein
MPQRECHQFLVVEIVVKELENAVKQKLVTTENVSVAEVSKKKEQTKWVVDKVSPITEWQNYKNSNSIKWTSKQNFY